MAPWFHRQRSFIGIYAADESLHLWLHGLSLDFASGNVKALRDKDFLLRKRFRVYNSQKLVFKCHYSYLDDEDVSDEDIFSYISRSSESIETQLRTLLIWQNRSEGRGQPAQSYFDGLSGRIKEKLDTLGE